MANLLKEHVQVNISSNIYLYLSPHIYTGPAGGELPLPRAARAAHHHRDAQPARHLSRLGCPGQLPSDLQSVSKKMVFSGKTDITTFKLIQNAKVGGVLENSGYLLLDGH